MNLPIVSAVLGGCFDPLHNGHVMLARKAYAKLPVDQVFLVPNGAPPYRNTVASWPARVEMCKLGVDEFDGIEVELIESPEQQRPSITTARQLIRRGNTLIWVVGADAFSSLGDWVEWELLLPLINWAVMPRPNQGSWLPESPHAAKLAQDCLVLDPEELSEGCGKVWLWEEAVSGLSAEQIRRSIAAGKNDWRGQVPVAVANYIENNNLYSCLAN